MMAPDPYDPGATGLKVFVSALGADLSGALRGGGVTSA